MPGGSNIERNSTWIYQNGFTDRTTQRRNLIKRLKMWKRRWGSNCLYGKKTYIEYGVFRQYGETTAKILRLLITPGKIVDFTEQPRGDRERFFRKELLEVKAKLNAAGVQTNEVYTNKKDLYRAMNERTGGSK